METIISYKKLSHLFLFPGIIYGKIQPHGIVCYSVAFKGEWKGRQFSRESFKGGVKWRAGAEGACLSPCPSYELMFMNKDIVTPKMYKILGHWFCVTKFNMTIGK